MNTYLGGPARGAGVMGEEESAVRPLGGIDLAQNGAAAEGNQGKQDSAQEKQRQQTAGQSDDAQGNVTEPAGENIVDDQIDGRTSGDK